MRTPKWFPAAPDSKPRYWTPSFRPYRSKEFSNATKSASFRRPYPNQTKKTYLAHLITINSENPIYKLVICPTNIPVKAMTSNPAPLRLASTNKSIYYIFFIWKDFGEPKYLL